jgi:hypothetical protein
METRQKQEETKRRVENNIPWPQLIDAPFSDPRAAGQRESIRQTDCRVTAPLLWCVALVGEYENKTDRDWLFLDSCYFLMGRENNRGVVIMWGHKLYV